MGDPHYRGVRFRNATVGSSRDTLSWRDRSSEDALPSGSGGYRGVRGSGLQTPRIGHQIREPRGPIHGSNGFTRGGSHHAHDSSAVGQQQPVTSSPGGWGRGRSSEPSSGGGWERGRSSSTSTSGGRWAAASSGFGFAGDRGRGNGWRNHGGGNQKRTKFNLSELVSQDPDEVIIFFTAKARDFEELLQSEFDGEAGDRQLVSLLDIIAQKLCGPSNLVTQRNTLVATCCRSSFLNRLLDLILQLKDSTEALETSPIGILNNLHIFAKYVSDKMPSQFPDKFLALARTAELVVTLLQSNSMGPESNNSDEECEGLGKKFHELKTRLQDYKKKRDDAVRSSGSDAQSERAVAAMERKWRTPPPDDFRSIPIIPTREELLATHQPFLRPTLVHGKYPSAQDYLDTHFRLLREDFVAPLRQGIQDYFLIKDGKKKMSTGTVKIYTNVQLFPRLNFDTHTPYYVMKLDYEHNRALRRVKWNKSKRLLPQTLILLTNDNFETIYFATICRRDEKNLSHEGKFGISWEGRKPPFSRESYFDILECEVYFEAYRHTLTTLRRLEIDDFPMLKYILDGDTTHRIPLYIQAIGKSVNFRPLLFGWVDDDAEDFGEDYGMGDICEPTTWPSAEQLGMDDSQYSAFTAALTREISIIQGPPGTGKTYIAIQIAKFLLSNRNIFFPEATKTRHLNRHLVRRVNYLGIHELVMEEEEEEVTSTGRPVLVVCYTNHALDQFLEAVVGIMKTMKLNPRNHLVRVGFQTKSDEMKELLLDKRLDEEVASDSGRLSFGFKENLRRAKGKLRGIKNERSRLIGSLRVLKNSEGILNLYDYFENLTCRADLNLSEAERNFLSSLYRHHVKQGNLAASFGLDHNDFYDPNFNGLKWMRRTFRFASSTNRRELPQLPQQFNILQPPQIAGDDDDDDDGDEGGKPDEDFDLQELMSNRLQELNFELDIEVKRAEAVKPNYLINTQAEPWSHWIQDLTDFIRQQEKIGKSSGFEHEESMEVVRARIMLSEEMFAMEQKFKTIREVVRGYQEKRLTFPPVTPTGSYDVLPAPLMTWAIYFQLLEKCKTAMMKRIFEYEEELQGLDESFKQAQNSCYGQILKSAMFVGMTTTGAAKYNSLLPVMQSRLVIVEEAAEVLESHVMTCITKDCEQLILIGDHKQLRPKTAVYSLARQYHLDVSLFERMINNNLNLYLLEVQHRMRPEICELIVPTIYERLANHESVYKYPPVLGLESNMFFISHKEPERQDEDSTSKSNAHEASFLVQLCRHLVLQGYSTERITILTTYIGQMFLIKKKIREESPLCQGVRVTVVDNFQGEENDIILLSLVRSNDDGRIGFLSIENRICVALSRAKHGFYVIGNMASMAASSPTWTKIMSILSSNHKVGPELILKCEVHGDLIPATVAADFNKAPEGGCSRMCEGRLPKCTHLCRLVCHVADKDHEEYQCQFRCEQKCEKYSHQCRGACYEICPRCTVRVDTVLPCAHSTVLECYVDAESYLCPEAVLKSLPCNHVLAMKCSEDPTVVDCRQIVEKHLPCGHSHYDMCFVKAEQIQCLTIIPAVNPACNHPTKIMCYLKDDPSSWACGMKCDTRTPCGHACVKNCHPLKDPEHENYECRKDCARTCPLGHECSADQIHKHKCHSKCPDCEVPVDMLLGCGHDAIVPCFQSLDENHVVQCNVPTKKKSIDCPHEISVPCSQVPSRILCTELLVSIKKSPCGHAVEVPCNMDEKLKEEELLSYCQMPCGEMLFDPDGKVGCGHACQGSCSKCFRGKLHQKCGKKCDRVLVCGHMCTFPCSAVCPPCTQKCDFRCVHSKCKSKCGMPCPSCKEPCDASCPHSSCTKSCGKPCDRTPCNEPCTIQLKCGHPCVGLCSEPCPKLCRICDVDAEEFKIFFGNEEEPDARYLELEDCGHIFEVCGLDNWIMTKSSAAPEKSVDVKRCPRCKTIILSSHRYKDSLKEAYAEVIGWKKRIFGQTKQISSGLLRIANRLEQDMTFREVRSIYFFIRYMSLHIYGEGSNAILTSRHELKIAGGYDNRVSKKMDQFLLESLLNMFQWCEEAVMNLRAPPEVKTQQFPYGFRRWNLQREQDQKSQGPKGLLTTTFRLELEQKYVELLTEVTRRTLPLSRMEVKQFYNEFQRLSDLFQLYRRYSVEEFEKFKVKGKCDTIKAFLLESPCWNESAKHKFQVFLREVDETMKLSLPTVKRETLKAIFSALDSAGTWYMCPNKHLYLIGDCGNPNATSTCPDCRETIGAAAYHVSAAGNVRVAAHRELPPATEFIPTPDFLE